MSQADKAERKRAAQSRYRKSAKGREAQRRYRARVGRPDNERRLYWLGMYVGMAREAAHVPLYLERIYALTADFRERQARERRELSERIREARARV